ncbi:MAG: AraC family transcriptional regulator, partial [Cyclobacteriaceae bacterium]|nr:AraC family transcriptional regulator [Cyclobacteriaceae bacterium]
DNVEAYQLYLQGRFYYNKFSPDDFIKAIEYFEAAIAADSTYAIAYAGKSFCYMNLWSFNWLPPEKSLPQALKAAQEALDLDGEIAESHLAVGRVKLHYEWNISEALVEYKKAIAINPNSAECHVQLSFCAVLMGNNDEAMKHAKIAENLDPFSLLNLSYLEGTAIALGDFDKVLALGKRLIDLEPNFSVGYEAIGDYYCFLKNYKEAIHEYESVLALNYSTHNLSQLGLTYGLMGEKLKAIEVIEKMKKIPGSELGGNNYYLGSVFASIGELDAAFQYFDKALENREGNMLWMKYFVFERIPELKKDPRANKLLEKIGVPPL